MAAALKTWELENAITLTDPTRDALYNYDSVSQKAAVDAKPWKSDSKYFLSTRISAVALLKMTMHARSGGSIEIMGLMTGYISGRSIIVTDALRLPVEGTETRVNAQAEADEYMVQFLDSARKAGQMENAVGWYHSHPGYGCWLSGIDVSTQATQQMFSDPFVAVVIDPDRTISAGRVEIGAFRTLPNAAPAGLVAGPESEKKDAGVVVDDEDDGEDADGFQSIPLGKIEDFGAYADKYYSLEVTHFKSSLDTKLLEALWNKYWVSTLAASPLFTNREYGTRQIADLAMKIKGQADISAARARGGGGGQIPSVLGGMHMGGGGGKKEKQRDEQLEKIVKAGRKIAMEEESGLMAAEIKEKLFAGVGKA